MIYSVKHVDYVFGIGHAIMRGNLEEEGSPRQVFFFLPPIQLPKIISQLLPEANLRCIL